MKKTILWVILLLLMIATIPITAGINVINSTNKKVNNTIKENTDFMLNEAETEAVICNVMEYITEDYNLQCKKAVVSLCKNNALVRKSEGLPIKTTKVSKYSDTFYDEIRNILNEDEFSILLNGERVHIPIVKICPGYIVESEKYPYISSIACPWDTQSTQYDKNFDYPCGISVYGINHLGTLGFDSKYILSYFLPQFEIN